MDNSRKLQQLAKEFILKLHPPAIKPIRPFVLATIGLIGSGRTTIARRIAELIPGTILVSANSARYLLRELAGMEWGQNVRDLVKFAAEDLLAKGYGIIFDGNAADEKDRQNISEIAQESDAKIMYLRINIDPTIARKHEEKKYRDKNWLSTFENYRVNTLEKMLANLDERTALYAELNSSEIPDLVAEIDNNGSLKELEVKVDQSVQKIKAELK